MQVDPGQMQFLMSTAALPMVAKPIYGIISDSVYIKGAHRVPYLLIAGETVHHHLYQVEDTYCVAVSMDFMEEILWKANLIY